MTQSTLAFVGGGNMATSLVAGLIADGQDPNGLIVSDPDQAKLDALAERYGVGTIANNATAVRDAQIIVLCVKPQIAQQVCAEIAPAVADCSPLLISIMAGIREQDLREWLGHRVPVVRAMPNTPAMIQSGAIALHATPDVTPDQRNQAETVLRACGLTRWVEQEKQMDAATALSGSGPAYFFLIMEILEQVGSELGLNAENARLLTIQTALGAARMAMESTESPGELRRRVTSPGGTTESALDVLESGNIRALLAAAVTAARDRSQQLSHMLAETK